MTPSEITPGVWRESWWNFIARRNKSRSATDVEPAPVKFTTLTMPVISPRWWDNYIWVASGRGWPERRYADDIREILCENSIKDMRKNKP